MRVIPHFTECYCSEWSEKYLAASILPSLATPVQTKNTRLPASMEERRVLSGNCGRVLLENGSVDAGMKVFLVALRNFLLCPR